MSAARVFYCTSCQSPTIEPFIMNGIRLCEICAEDIQPRRSGGLATNWSGFQQPRVERNMRRRRIGDRPGQYED